MACFKLFSLLFIAEDRKPARISAMVLIGVVGGISYFVILVCYILFSANVIQFGMDQLVDSSNEDSTLFIYWYVWTYYLGVSFAYISFGVYFLVFCG